jgi:hypothetical protein
MSIISRVFPLSGILLLTPFHAEAQPDSAGVRQAALDYIEGFYQGDSTRHMRSIHPSVYKYGFARSGSSYQGMQMTWPEFHTFTRNVRTRNQPANSLAIKQVQLLDVLDQTAAAKVTAYWGTDYLLMGRIDGRWMITHVIWQSFGPNVWPGAQPMTLAQFRALHWLAGRWRGSGGSFPAFFEEYVVLNDSTVRQYTLADSTFRQPTDSAFLIWRNGQVAQVRNGRPTPLVRLAGDTARFAGPASGGWSWIRTGAESWRAVLAPVRPGQGPTVYELQRPR